MRKKKTKKAVNKREVLKIKGKGRSRLRRFISNASGRNAGGYCSSKFRSFSGALKALFDEMDEWRRKTKKVDQKLLNLCKQGTLRANKLLRLLRSGAKWDALDASGRNATDCCALNMEKKSDFDFLLKLKSPILEKNGRGFLENAAWNGNRAAMLWWIENVHLPVPASEKEGKIECAMTIALERQQTSWLTEFVGRTIDRDEGRLFEKIVETVDVYSETEYAALRITEAAMQMGCKVSAAHLRDRAKAKGWDEMADFLSEVIACDEALLFEKETKTNNQRKARKI